MNDIIRSSVEVALIYRLTFDFCVVCPAPREL